MWKRKSPRPCVLEECWIRSSWVGDMIFDHWGISCSINALNFLEWEILCRARTLPHLNRAKKAWTKQVIHSCLASLLLCSMKAPYQTSWMKPFAKKRWISCLSLTVCVFICGAVRKLTTPSEFSPDFNNNPPPPPKDKNKLSGRAQTISVWGESAVSTNYNIKNGA